MKPQLLLGTLAIAIPFAVFGFVSQAGNPSSESPELNWQPISEIFAIVADGGQTRVRENCLESYTFDNLPDPASLADERAEYWRKLKVEWVNTLVALGKDDLRQALSTTLDGHNPPGIIAPLAKIAGAWDRWPERFEVLVRDVSGLTGPGGTQVGAPAGKNELLIARNKLIIPWPFTGLLPSQQDALERVVGVDFTVPPLNLTESEWEGVIFVDAVFGTADRVSKYAEDARGELGWRDRVPLVGDQLVKSRTEHWAEIFGFGYALPFAKKLKIKVARGLARSESGMDVSVDPLVMHIGWEQDLGFHPWLCGAPPSP